MTNNAEKRSQRIEAPIIRPGIHRVFAEQSQPTNADVTDEQRKAISSGRSNLPYLENVIFNQHHERNVSARPLESGGKVAVIWQLQPWQAGAAMISVNNEAIENHTIATDENGVIPVQFVYEAKQGYTREHQVGYAREILRLMDVMTETSLPDEETPEGFPTVVAMENAVSELGRGRTLATQHAAVIKNGVGEVDPIDKPIFSRDLLLSKRLQQAYPHKEAYLARVAENMQEILGPLGEEIDFSLRVDEPPFGYTMALPIYRDENLDARSEKFAAITRAHYFSGKSVQRDVYALLGEFGYSNKDDKTTGERFKDRGAVEPYAYTHYFYYVRDENGREQLHFTASPTIFGGATLENAGAALNRSENNELPYSTDQEARYKQTVKRKMNPQ